MRANVDQPESVHLLREYAAELVIDEMIIHFIIIIIIVIF